MCIYWIVIILKPISDNRIYQDIYNIITFLVIVISNNSI